MSTRVVVAHEWLTNWAGSEAVALRMAHVAGASEFVSSIVDAKVAQDHLPQGLRVRELWPGRLPSADTHWQRYAPAMMAAWSGTRIDADLLLVSSHFAAHAATLRHRGPSLVYYHTPARILWRPDLELGRLGNAAKRGALRASAPSLRAWDRRMAQAATVVVANSTSIADRVWTTYGRRAEVVPPPVDVDKWAGLEERPRRHVLVFGRLVKYKNVDFALQVARHLDCEVLVVGDGPERPALERVAPPNVRFRGRVHSAELREILASSTAMIFPGEEDFGIAPVEAIAAGVPVIALDAGGARDYIQEGINGHLVPGLDLGQFVTRTVEAANSTWSRSEMTKSVARFAVGNFDLRMKSILSLNFGLET